MMRYSLRKTPKWIVVAIAVIASLGWVIDHLYHRRQVKALRQHANAVSVYFQSKMESLDDAVDFYAEPHFAMVSRVDETVARRVGEVSTLRYVSFMDGEATDAIVRELAPLHGLTTLNFNGGNGRITDAGLQTIVDSFPHLETLYIWGNPLVTGEEVTGMDTLKKLRVLRMCECGVTTRGIENLKLPQSLVELNLDGTAIDDGALASIGELRGLRRLDIAHTEITDNGLESLKSLSNLTNLRLSSDRISQEAASRLQQEIPNCLFFGVEKDACKDLIDGEWRYPGR